jgi:hypothetical protein
MPKMYFIYKVAGKKIQKGYILVDFLLFWFSHFSETNFDEEFNGGKNSSQ